MTEPNTNISGKGGITDSATCEVAEVGKTLIQGIAPAEKGWILGFIVVVAIIVLSDMWVNIRTLQANITSGERVQTYFEQVETNRSTQLDNAMEQWADQTRRYQEVIRALTESVARDSERAGQAAVAAIDDASRSQYIRDTADPNFIGPPEADQ